MVHSPDMRTSILYHEDRHMLEIHGVPKLIGRKFNFPEEELPTNQPRTDLEIERKIKKDITAR